MKAELKMLASQSVRAELVEVDERTGRRRIQNIDTAGQPWHNSRVGKRRVALAPRWELPGFRPSASRDSAAPARVEQRGNDSREDRPLGGRLC